MADEENGFLEYLQLQGGKADLVTKSELINEVRERGYSLSDRNLTFYVTEGIIPRSVRVGSRAGAYPKIVIELMTWVLEARDEGVPLDALRELLPVWKFLIGARRQRMLDLAELEYVARQHVSSIEASIVVPRVVTHVMRRFCPQCRTDFKLIYKNGAEVSLTHSSAATIGFALARTVSDNGGGKPRSEWYASTRITLAIGNEDPSDPTTVILGVKPNAPLPPDKPGMHHEPADTESEEVRPEQAHT